jgi:hypothetical protein
MTPEDVFDAALDRRPGFSLFHDEALLFSFSPS